MPRPSKDSPIDLSRSHSLTAGLIARLTCPIDKDKVLLRDSEVLGLRVRVTKNGVKSFVFEKKNKLGEFISKTIGSTKVWSIEQARAEARRLSVMIDRGIDPRKEEKLQQEEAALRKANALLNETKTETAWKEYVTERTHLWGELHRRDHERLTREGGAEANRGTRGKGLTTPGPLFPLMKINLRELSTSAIEDWAANEGAIRPTTARLSWRLLRAFLRWCAEHPQYRNLVPSDNPAKTRKTREALGKVGVKKDTLLRTQLPAWFAAVQLLPNGVISAYLQCVLLTGCRPGEMLRLRWEDIDTKWLGITLQDKVEGSRTIPLTPYVNRLLQSLPRQNQYVFCSSRKTDSHITEPNNAHHKACQAAGIEELTLHGLRRSFKSLSEWLEIPGGVIAQIQGHRPSATAEKHYTVRPLDLLRIHHQRFEKWLLDEAKITPDPDLVSQK